MMSSETSTDPSTRMTTGSLGAGARGAIGRGDLEPLQESALQPWQFFLLAGMLGATAAVVVATGQSMASIVTLSLTVVAASMVGLGVYRMLLPLVRPLAIRPPEMIGGRARAVLEREKMLVLRAIKDLEFDRGMGKVGQADFDEMSARLRGRAVGLMQQLEGAGAHRERIERELAERLAKLPQKKGVRDVSYGGPGLQSRPAPAEPAPVEPVDIVCGACGIGNDADARFCKGCGAKLEAAS